MRCEINKCQKLAAFHVEASDEKGRTFAGYVCPDHSLEIVSQGWTLIDMTMLDIVLEEAFKL